MPPRRWSGYLLAIGAGRLASGGFERTIKLWDMVDGVTHRDFEGHRQTICVLVFTSDETG